MRRTFSVSAAGRIAAGILVVAAAGSLLLTGSPKRNGFTVHDKAYYADVNTVNFVRPGLVFKIVSASIAADGTITARVTMKDPQGMNLDRLGVNTPGAVSASLVAAFIPKGKTQYTSYTTRTQTSPITKVSAIQAGADSGGTWVQNDVGDYTYTFATKAPAGYDKGATHSVMVYGSRNLADFSLPTNYATNVYNFVPDGSAGTGVRDVIKNQSCNKCHDQLAFHGGSRVGIESCVMCHTPQTTDPDTGNTVDLPVMVHRIHAGSSLPSVKDGKPYQIIGNGQSVSDFSEVTSPSDVRQCEVCHEQKTGAKQAAAYLTPNRAACGACHDNVDFATGKNHANLPQISDNQCANCHTPQGELEFDVSIKGAHMLPANSAQHPGLNFEILKVDASAGKAPTVTFKITDNQGKGIPINQLTGSTGRMALVLAGPTTDYGYTSFGSDQLTGGYISEDPTGKAQCAADGTCTYTFNHAIPAGAKGTFSIGAEGRRVTILNAGTAKQTSAQRGANNVVFNFSVDGSQLAARRTSVDINKCNQCHTRLSMHGENRNQIQQCVLCHNPSETDSTMRPQAKDPAVKNGAPQAVNFAMMAHKIHTGEKMPAEYGTDYTIVAYGGNMMSFGEVKYPAMSKNGRTGERRNCGMCHVNGSETILTRNNRNMVKDPQGLINPVGPITSACTGCHQNIEAASHALTNTSTLGEACATCHGTGAEFDINKVHAQ